MIAGKNIRTTLTSSEFGVWELTAWTGPFADYPMTSLDKAKFFRLLSESFARRADYNEREHAQQHDWSI